MHSRQPEPHPASSGGGHDVRTRDILGVPVAMVDYDRAIGVMDALVERARARATSAPLPCTR